MRMLQIKGRIDPGNVDAAKEIFRNAAAKMNELLELEANVTNEGPFLPPWVPVVCVAPVCPHGITCSRPRKV